MKTVGFIGLGTMGKPMALNLIHKGYSVTVYNRSSGKADGLAALGAKSVSSPAEAARAVAVLFTMVSDNEALKQVYYGENGILAGAQPGLTVIDCSTVSPDLSRQLQKDLAARYVHFLDAPVTGSEPAAIAGTLTFLVGGKKEVADDQMEIFHALGSKVIYLGPSGSGSQTKLANNTIVGINLAALAEGMAIAVKSGIPAEKFVEVVLGSGAGSKIAEAKADKILDRDFIGQFSLQLMLKDLQLSSELTSQLGVPSPMLRAAQGIFQEGVDKGLGLEDVSSVVQCYEDWIHQKIQRTRHKSVDVPAQAEPSGRDRRKKTRLSMDIKLHLSVYQWEQEGSFSGQTIAGTLVDLSESGLQISSSFPLAEEMFLIIHFPQEADLPPIIGKILRIFNQNGIFKYGCSLSGLAPYIRIKLEEYIESKLEQ